MTHSFTHGQWKFCYSITDVPQILNLDNKNDIEQMFTIFNSII